MSVLTKPVLAPCQGNGRSQHQNKEHSPYGEVLLYDWSPMRLDFIPPNKKMSLLYFVKLLDPIQSN